MRLITDAEALQRELNSLSLVGCRVLTFDVVGRLHGLTHQSMLDFYNVCMVPEGGPYRKPGAAIFEDEIPLSLERTRMVSTEGPCIMRLDDGRTLDIRVADFSEAAVSASRRRVFKGNAEVDANRIMQPVIGERISAVKVARMGGDDFERQFVDGISDPFKYIRINCERHSLYLSYLTYAVMSNVERLDPLGMTMGELKEAVSYYSDLFDQA